MAPEARGNRKANHYMFKMQIRPGRSTARGQKLGQNDNIGGKQEKM